MAKGIRVVLRALRHDRAFTQVELAKKAKVALSYITLLETGEKNNPSLAILLRLAKALDVSVAELFD